MKFKDEKIVGNLLEKLRKNEHEWNRQLEIFSRPEVIESSPNRYFIENSRLVPLT